MAIQIEFTRKGQFIKNESTGQVEDHKSISKAKRWSMVWQKANGGLGCGKLRVTRA